MNSVIKILFLEDNPHDFTLIKHELKTANVQFIPEWVQTKNEFVAAIKDFRPDLVLSDHSLPSFNSLDAFKILKDSALDIPFILVTGTVSEEFAVECMKTGVDDYILKSNLARLPSSIQHVLTKRQITIEKEILEELYDQLEASHHEITEKNQQITKSINYAKRIQGAMLPGISIIKKIFPHSFKINKAKDIVSGDFYWVAEYDNKVFVAVADCTGHGIPGALLSMMGFNLLNEIVNINTGVQPGKILNKLNGDVQRILKQNTKDNQTRDGMEIAICSIDRINNKIEFAGANRPLFHFKNGELNIIKGNNFGIGGAQLDEKREYTTYTTSFDKGDVLYLFTDGFTDQFGGPRGKKLMTRNFIDLLQSVQPFDMSEQEQMVNKFLRSWKNVTEQTDDILLIGIKL